MIELFDSPWFWPVIVAPFVGSFLGVLVTRLPIAAPVVIGRSACDHCGRHLGIGELIPLVSWLILHGRCRACGGTIDRLLPVIELMALAVPLWAALSPGAPPPWPTAVLGWTLLCLAAIDARHFLLPDRLTLPLIVAGLAAALLDGPDQLAASVLGSVLGFTAFAGLRLAYRRLRGREGLGFGDVKLLAAGGAWVGWQGLPSMVLLAAVMALAVTLIKSLRGGTLATTDKVPFGTYLCLGLWLVWLYGPLTVG